VGFNLLSFFNAQQLSHRRRAFPAMKAICKLPLTDAAQPSNDGHPAEIIPPLSKHGAPGGGFPKNRLLLLVILIVVILFIQACWNLVHTPQGQPAVLELLTVCLLVSAAAVGAALGGCQALSESARLAKERDLLRTIIDNLPDYIYAKDKQGRFVLNNLAHAKDVGAASPGAMMGKSDRDYFPRELAEQFLADEQKIIATGQSVINQEQYKCRPGDESGKKYWSATSKVIWRDQGGDVLGTVGITRDIHEVKMAQEALHQSEEQLQAMLDNVPDQIYFKDTQSRFLKLSRGVVKRLGLEHPEQAVGKTDFDFFSPERAREFYEDEQRIIRSGEALVNKMEKQILLNGEIGWASTTKIPLRNREGKVIGVAGINRDITELKQAEAALLKSQALYHSLVTQLPIGIFRKDEQGRFVLVNPGFCRHKGIKAEEFLGRTPAEVGITAARGGTQELTNKYADEGEKHHWQIMQTGQPIELDEEYSPAGGRKLFVHVMKFPVLDPDGKIIGSQGVLFDITERKQAEEALHRSEEKLRQFAAQLEQSNRELQDFAYVASHDLQEPLRKIVVFGERLKEKNNDALGADGRDYLERMQKAATRMQTLINDLLTFSRVTSKAHPFAPVNLAEVVREVMDDLEGRIEQVKGRVEVVGELPVIDAEKLQMRQLLQNLIGNALKFRRPEEPPLVTVAARKFSDSLGWEFCELSIRDNGIGFDEKYLDRIFNVFQRLHTRNEYEGTGMGLAIVRKIVMYHGGNITAKSQPGQGATFVVTLPLAHPEKAETHNEKDNHEN
jgi:two-component system sensor kinase FixL